MLVIKDNYLIEKENVTHFISGMAIGIDMYAAEIVLDLKKSYPGITLELSYEQLNTPFALSSLVLNVEIYWNRFHDFIMSLHFL